MGLPDEEGLGGTGFVARFRRGFEFGVFEARGETGVDFVVPAAAHAPSGFAVFANHFPRHLVGGGGFPAPGFEIEVACFASGVVSDFHGAVIVNGGGAGDDADDGAGHFFPCVEFFAAGSRAQFEKPGTEGVDVEGFTVELGLHS